jgi:hypothetical protein
MDFGALAEATLEGAADFACNSGRLVASSSAGSISFNRNSNFFKVTRVHVKSVQLL